MAFIKSNRLVKSVLLGVIVIAFLEIFVFNFRHWATAGYTAADAQSYVTGHGYSVTVSDDGSFILNDSNDTWITFENMNMSLNTIFLDVPDGEDSTLTVGVYANDEANLAGFDLQTTTVCSTVKLTKYLRTHLSGQSDYMKIYFQNVTPGTTIRGIQLKRTIPFQISFLRIVLMVVIWVFFVLFGAKSSLYKVPVTEWKTNKKQAVAIAGAILFQCVLLYLIGYIVRPGQNMQAEIDNGVYVHGIFDKEDVAMGLVRAVGEKKGIDVSDMAGVDFAAFKETQYDILASELRKHLDMKRIYEILEEGIETEGEAQE